MFPDRSVSYVPGSYPRPSLQALPTLQALLGRAGVNSLLLFDGCDPAGLQNVRPPRLDGADAPVTDGVACNGRRGRNERIQPIVDHQPLFLIRKTKKVDEGERVAAARERKCGLQVASNHRLLKCRRCIFENRRTELPAGTDDGFGALRTERL